MRLALEADMTIIGEAGNGQEALELAASLRPNAVLMDVEMPIMDGVAAAQRIHALLPDCAVVVSSIHDTPTTRARALAAGATAFVSKQEPIDRLLATIRQAVI